MSHHLSNLEPVTAQPAEFVPGARILIVDDDDILRGLCEAVLTLAGYGTQCATDGQEALEMLASGDFDLIVTDRNMPRLGGVGLIRAVRAAGLRIPIMMVSGSLANGGELPEDVRDEVAVALPKPAKTSDLLAGVACALRQSGKKPPRETLTPRRTPPRPTLLYRFLRRLAHAGQSLQTPHPSI